jgi:hypothetical protein
MIDETYLEIRKQVEQFFIPENLKPDSGKVDISPLGKFQIEISQYATLPNRWDYSRGVVIDRASRKVIADIKRNHTHFWHTWVQHLNGSEYLLCAEDYQGYSIINLNSQKQHIYFPEAGYEGTGFCWTKVYPSPDGLVLAVDGCYWACPYELVILDFRNPEMLPYPERVRFEMLVDCDGWIDNHTFMFKHEVEVRKSDGTPYLLLSKQEQEIFDKDPSLADYRIETKHYKRTDM